MPHTRLLAASWLVASWLVAAATVAINDAPSARRGSTAAPEEPAAPIVAADAGVLLPNGRQPFAGLLTGGQPSREQLEAIAAAGYRTVINLRGEGEAQPALADLARELGLRYVRLPVAGAPDLTAEKAAELGAILADRAAYPLVIHCGSGNRVGALLALEQARVESKDPQEALSIGLAAGLTSLEPTVRDLLGLPPP